MMRPIRVLLADDHALVRAGFKALLREIDGIEVIAEAGDGREALRLVREMQPDVVLMDISMPELNGLEVTSQAAKEFNRVRVIILSMYMNEEYVMQALSAGAKGYLLKDAGPEELALAIRRVSRGDIYLCPAVSKTVITDYIDGLGGKSKKQKSEHGVFERLTSRQREILQLIAEGFTTKEISDKLNVSIKTVETHRTQLMKRLDIHDIAGLVRYAIRSGIVSPQR